LRIHPTRLVRPFGTLRTLVEYDRVEASLKDDASELLEE
jgi:hypothetical protein